MSKICDICQKEIPDDFVNNLCWECYQKQAQSPPDDNLCVVETTKPTIPTKNGIADPDYIENPQAEDKEQWEANIRMFARNGVMLWKPTRQMYTFIKEYNLNKITQHPQYPKFIWKPKIVDVGCGCGVGANVLSQEADFVWGIDKNLNSIRFAKESFERVKNNIYYSAQLTYDQIDIMQDSRDFAKFDQVVAIEIIEHIDDYRAFISTIINKFDKRDSSQPTEYFISSPNRNNRMIMKNTPRNKYHVREWTSGELYVVLSEFFEHIVLMNAIGVEILPGEYETTTHTPLLCRCWGPKI